MAKKRKARPQGKEAGYLGKYVTIEPLGGGLYHLDVTIPPGLLAKLEAAYAALAGHLRGAGGEEALKAAVEAAIDECGGPLGRGRPR